MRPHAPSHAGAASAPDELAASLDAALVPGAVRSLYQPIVDLRTGATVAVEALARGPEGPLERPDGLFAAARELGRLGELERACQDAAVTGALRAGLDVPLFVNMEPEAMEIDGLGALARTAALMGSRAPLVLEITERALTSRPAELIDLLSRARRLGWVIALDDVGADPRSLGLLPVVRPDVVKLDRALIQRPPDATSAAVLTAVAAECERTGALVLAEGIETPRHLRTALATGATLGQGWLFGAPAPLPHGLTGPWRPPRLADRTPGRGDDGPYAVVAPGRPVRRARWKLLLEMSLVLEAHAAALGEECVVVAAFQDAERFTPATAERYAALARRASLVAAFGVGMPPAPAPGVRGAALPPDHPLRGEWSVVVLAPHFAGALVAREVEGPATRPEFTYALSYDRERVVRAATALLRLVVPLGAAG